MNFSDNRGNFGQFGNGNPLDKLKIYFRQNNDLVKLILVNIGVWIVLLLLNTLLWLFQSNLYSDILSFLAVHSNFRILLTHPWTLVSYMFVHEGFWHIFFNMLWLYWFGKIFLEYLTERQLVAIYFLGGIAGALFFVLTFNVFPSFDNVFHFSYAIGASASVMAIITAISFYAPNYRMNLIFIGPVKIIWLAVFFFIYDFISIKSGNPGGHLAHIGGAIFGWYFAYALRNGKDITLSFSGFANWFMNLFQRKKKFTVSYSGKKVSDQEYNHNKKENQKTMDEILDKISKSGYNSLSKAEKDFLFRASKK